MSAISVPDVDVRADGCPLPEQHAERRFGLPTASALVVGSVIGTGVFALPSALAAFGPISLVAFGLVTVGAIALALTFRALDRRGSRLRRAVRVRAGRVRRLRRVPQRVELLDHRVGRQRRDRGGLGRLRRGVLEHRPRQGRGRSSSRWSACGCRPR